MVSETPSRSHNSNQHVFWQSQLFWYFLRSLVFFHYVLWMKNLLIA